MTKTKARKRPQKTVKRLVIEIPPAIHHDIRLASILRDMSIRNWAIETFLEKIEKEQVRSRVSEAPDLVDL